MNLINALAPPVLASLMAGIGARGTFAVLVRLSIAAFAVLMQLKPHEGEVGARRVKECSVYFPAEATNAFGGGAEQGNRLLRLEQQSADEGAVDQEES